MNIYMKDHKDDYRYRTQKNELCNTFISLSEQELVMTFENDN